MPRREIRSNSVTSTQQKHRRGRKWYDPRALISTKIYPDNDRDEVLRSSDSGFELENIIRTMSTLDGTRASQWRDTVV